MTNCRMTTQHSRTDEHGKEQWWQEPCTNKATRGGYCEEHSAGHARRVVEMWQAKAREAQEGVG